MSQATMSRGVTAPAPKLSLPDDIRTVVRTFAAQSATVRRNMMRELRDYMDEVPHGAKMIVYGLIAAEWNDTTGEHVSERTVRQWMHSVSAYSAHDLRDFALLSDALLIEAVNLADIRQNGTTPQDICVWAVANACDSVPLLRAHFLPQTSTGYEIDPPWVSGLKRYIVRAVVSTDPRWTRINELITELRKLIS